MAERVKKRVMRSIHERSSTPVKKGLEAQVWLGRGGGMEDFEGNVKGYCCLLLPGGDKMGEVSWDRTMKRALKGSMCECGSATMWGNGEWEGCGCVTMAASEYSHSYCGTCTN